MHLLGIPILILQAICAVHAVKTGRANSWLWIILVLPGIGAAVYFFAEMMPDLKRSSSVRRVGADLATFVDPGRSIRQLDEAELGIRAADRDLLYARTLGQLGQFDAAFEQYEAIVRRSSGEETRCRYALLLQETGQTEKARQVFHEILARARRSPRYYRRDQSRWVALASQNLRR